MCSIYGRSLLKEKKKQHKNLDKKKKRNQRKAWINRNVNGSLGFLNERSCFRSLAPCVCELLFFIWSTQTGEEDEEPTKAFIILEDEEKKLPILVAAFCFYMRSSRRKDVRVLPLRREKTLNQVFLYFFWMPHSHTQPKNQP